MSPTYGVGEDLPVDDALVEDLAADGPATDGTRFSDALGKTVRFVAATGALGSGIHEPSLTIAMEGRPHFVAADAGTTDAGPYYLGAGTAAFSRSAVKDDLRIMLQAGVTGNVPVLVGSAGTAGADVHVDWVLDIVREIIRERSILLDRPLRVGVVRSEPSRSQLLDLWDGGNIAPLNQLGSSAELFGDTEVLGQASKVLTGNGDGGAKRATIERADRIVAMMGVEPLQAALALEVDLVLAGRCSDAALYAAIPVAMGLPEGLAWHAGKIAECGTLACVTHGKGVLTVQIDENGIDIVPIGPDLRCTPQSIAAHSLYENADPYLHKECSGTLDLSESRFTALSDRAVRVTGSRFHTAAEYTMKLEGAELVGYQTLIIGGVRDPYIVAELDDWLDRVKAQTMSSAHRLLAEPTGDLDVSFHCYGRNGVMGALEPVQDRVPWDVGIVAVFTASTQERATALADLARQPLLHTPIAKWKGAITGFACLHSPAPIERGPVYRFCLEHVARPENPMALVSVELLVIGESSR